VGWWKVALGAIVVLLTVSEIFKDLFHPVQSGALSEWVARVLFSWSRRWPRLLPTVGPGSIAVVISLWALLLAVGFALIYWAFFPAAYDLQNTSPPSGSAAWWWSFYYSLEMMTTLGLGDIRPSPTWLKVLSATHTLLGFSLVTASITWILLIFPALRRMRTLSRKAATLKAAGERTGIPVVSPGMHLVLSRLAEEIIQARVDLIHFPILFYFYTEDERASLPGALQCLIDFAASGSDPVRDSLIRLESAGLDLALRDFADLIGDRLDCPNRAPASVFTKFSEMHTPASS